MNPYLPGYRCLELELSDEPPLGSWRIGVTEIVSTQTAPLPVLHHVLHLPHHPSPAQVNGGSCNNYYGYLSGSCDFKVDTFVLPRFEVKVTAPEYIHKSTENIEGSVSAE